MNTSFQKAIVLFGALICLSANCHAIESTNNKQKVAKKTNAKQQAKSQTLESELDIADYLASDYKCELGNSLTLFAHPEKEEHIGMRWKNRVFKMDKVETTTGALRFESKSAGFVWIGIPTKGLLLDARKGQQLANECKTAQIAQDPATQTGPKTSESLIK